MCEETVKTNFLNVLMQFIIFYKKYWTIYVEILIINLKVINLKILNILI